MPGAPKIYFNGCSQIENGHLDYLGKDYYKSSWPWLIAQEYQAEYRNDAISLGSNNRLIRTSINGILEFEPDIVIAGITDHNRIELPLANGDRCRINIHHCNTDNGSTQRPYQKKWYTDHHNNWLSFCSTLQIVYQLALLQKAHDFKLYLFNTVCDNHFTSWKDLLNDSFFVKYQRAQWRSKQEQETVRLLLSEIKNLNWLLPWDYNLYQLCKDKKWVTDEFGHPALSAQEDVKKIFMESLNEY